MINTLGGAGAEMALLELLEKLEKENEKTKDVQYEISLCSDGAGGTGEKLPKEVLLKNKSYQPLSVLQKEGRHFMYRTILKTMFVRGTVFCLLPYLLSSLADMLKRRKVLPDKLLWRALRWRRTFCGRI